MGSDEGDATSESTAATDEAAGTGARAAVDVAVSAEWNAIRGRVWDAVALGRGGTPDAGAAVAKDVFERFEKASGEHNAHEAAGMIDTVIVE